jgi:uncharacterized protein with HEPN domain
MSSKPRKWKMRIQHILDAIAENLNYIDSRTYEELSKDQRTLKAIVWNLTIIGEAARHIPREVETNYPEVPWAKMRGMRNHLVHAYDQIDPEIVWIVVRDELPPLIPVLQKVFAETTD